MKKSKRLGALTLFLAAAAAYALPAGAQSVSRAYTFQMPYGIPYVSAAFPNVGQSNHNLYACIQTPTGGGSTFASAFLELEASNDGVNFFAISTIRLVTSYVSRIQAGTSGCTTLTANGYFAFVRLDVQNIQVDGTPPATVGLSAIYSGSSGSTPPGGEPRAAGSSEKISIIPATSSYIDAALKSTGQGLPVADAIFSGSNTSVANFITGISIQNPNPSTAVFVQIGTATPVSSNLTQVFPVSGGASAVYTFTNPIYCPGAVYVACSTSATSEVDPATGCVVDVLYISQQGVASEVTAGGALNQSDNSGSAAPQ